MGAVVLVKPIYLAIALAVIILSPVTIRTVIPARWHLLIAEGTSFLGISLTPIIAIKFTDFFINKFYCPGVKW